MSSCSYTVSHKPYILVLTTVKPPAAQISKSVVSLLLKYNWRKVTFVYNNETLSRKRTADSIMRSLQEHEIEVVQTMTWNEQYYIVSFTASAY